MCRPLAGHWRATGGASAKLPSEFTLRAGPIAQRGSRLLVLFGAGRRAEESWWLHKNHQRVSFDLLGYITVRNGCGSSTALALIGMAQHWENLARQMRQAVPTATTAATHAVFSFVVDDAFGLNVPLEDPGCREVLGMIYRSACLGTRDGLTQTSA